VVISLSSGTSTTTSVPASSTPPVPGPATKPTPAREETNTIAITSSGEEAGKVAPREEEEEEESRPAGDDDEEGSAERQGSDGEGKREDVEC